jgi:acyl-coenzyme A thioesterase PaaI-like protein
MADEEDHTIAAFFATHTVPQSSLNHFSAIPWTAAYLQDPAYIAIPTFSRTLKETGEDAFFSLTVNTPTTIPQALCLRLRDFVTPVAPLASPYNRTTTTSSNPYDAPVPAKPDVILFMTLGSPGLDGHPATIHGGMATAILDEAIGLCVMLHQTHISDPRSAMFTARLDTVYRKPVQTPGVIAVKTWLTRREGRKWWARGQIVSKEGVVLTESEGLWLEARQRGQKL